MSDATTDTMNEEEQRRANSREHLWRHAMWSAIAHQQDVVKTLQDGGMPWVHEFAPLNREERVFVMGALCKMWFPDMTEEAEKECFQYLGAVYGVQNNVKKMTRSKKIFDRVMEWRKRHAH